MASNGIIFTANFMEIGLLLQQLKGEHTHIMYTCAHTERQHGDTVKSIIHFPLKKGKKAKNE